LKKWAFLYLALLPERRYGNGRPYPLYIILLHPLYYFFVIEFLLQHRATDTNRALNSLWCSSPVAVVVWQAVTPLVFLERPFADGQLQRKEGQPTLEDYPTLGQVHQCQWCIKVGNTPPPPPLPGKARYTLSDGQARLPKAPIDPAFGHC